MRVGYTMELRDAENKLKKAKENKAAADQKLRDYDKTVESEKQSKTPNKKPGKGR